MAQFTEDPVELSSSVSVSTTGRGMISLSTEGSQDQDTCASIPLGQPHSRLLGRRLKLRPG